MFLGNAKNLFTTFKTRCIRWKILPTKIRNAYGIESLKEMNFDISMGQQTKHQSRAKHGTKRNKSIFLKSDQPNTRIVQVRLSMR